MSEGPPTIQPESFGSRKQEATKLAQVLSHKLISLPTEDVSWQFEDADIAHIYSANDEAGGKTGIQKIFEERMASIESQTDAGLRNHLMYGLVSDLQRWNRQIDLILADHKS